jgi:tetratricopeptide (TPR) repeat protein
MNIIKRKLILAAVLGGFAISGYAKDASSTSFTLAAGTPLTEDVVDSCWANREDEDNQKIIADYLMTKPQVPDDYAVAWKTARLIYFIGNYGVGQERFVDTSAGVSLFDYGAQAGLKAQALKPKAVDGYYWYSVDLGSYGLAKGVMAAAKGAKPGMASLVTAQKINPAYEGYGSARILGRYYQELPGMFGGDMKKALVLIKGAADAAPSYRNNWVFLGQYYIAAGDYASANAACKKATELPPTDGKYEEMRYMKEAKECLKKAHT